MAPAAWRFPPSSIATQPVNPEPAVSRYRVPELGASQLPLLGLDRFISEFDTKVPQVSGNVSGPVF